MDGSMFRNFPVIKTWHVVTVVGLMAIGASAILSVLAYVGVYVWTHIHWL